MRGQLPRRISDWPEEARYEFEERAGIIQFDLRLRVSDAERLAEKAVRYDRETRANADRIAQGKPTSRCMCCGQPAQLYCAGCTLPVASIDGCACHCPQPVRD